MRTVLFPFTGSEMGGSHVSAFTLAQSLSEGSSFQPVILAAEDTLIAQEARSRGLTVHVTPEKPSSRHRHRLGHDLACFPARLRYLRSLTGRPIVHANDIGALQSWVPVARAVGYPSLYHSRSLHKDMFLNRWLMRLVDKNVCISEVTLDQFARFPRNRVELVVNPFSIDPEYRRDRARSDLQSELGIPHSSKIVGFIGNFWERKRPEFFLEAARFIVSQEPNAQFVFFGRDGDRSKESLQQISRRLGIEACTRFAGFRLPVEANVAALDLALYPAVREPFGRALVEALILGTPFVATDDAGHGEIVRRWGGALLVDPGATPAQFADQAVLALRNPEQASLSAAARRTLAEEVSPRGHARHMARIYNSLS